MLVILVGMDQKDTFAVLVLLVTLLTRCVSFVVVRPRCSSSWRSWTYAVGWFLSTAPCIWQSLVLFGSCRRNTVRVSSGRRLPEMPYSALLGSTMDTCYFQFTEAFVRIAFYLVWTHFTPRSQCSGLVLLVSTHFALCSLLLFPKPEQCLVFSGACYASVLGWLLEEFHDFLREGAHSAPEVDSRAAPLWP